jgi:polysaccharide export outer membrane protein
MGWKTVLLGLVLACACASAADTRAPAQQEPAQLRPSQAMPRYSVMTPPPSEEVPAAAPTTKIAVEPAPPVTAQPTPQPAAQPVSTPRANEQVTIAGLRPSEDMQYRLGTGDKLRLTVFNEPDLSGDFAIDGQGFVRLPLVGQVAAAGLTSLGLEERIGSAFVSGGFLLNPRVSVEIVSYRPFYIVGEVAKPGEYAYVNAMTAPNAIALAGGFTDRAVTSTIWVRHQGEAKEREVRADETTRIRPGDVVRVERTAYWAVMTLLAPLISPFATTAYILK